MSVHKHNSWGRTRSPKNLAGSQGGEVTPVESVATLAGVTAATAGTQGYNTENQRFLHVLIEDSGEDDGEAVTAYGYCHAFLRWFPLSTTVGGSTEVSITAEDTGNTAPASQNPNLRQYRCYEIAGIDKVAFVCADASEVNIFAACSTF